MADKTDFTTINPNGVFRQHQPFDRRGHTGNFKLVRGTSVLTQAWARKDQFIKAAPVSGGVGMKLLQKMGWQPGEGLGRNREGVLEPLALELKIDKKGLVSKDEEVQSQRSRSSNSVLDKHPVSVIHELCNRRRWDPPKFQQVLNVGPDHLKHFLFMVRVNGVGYRPLMASTTKKEAKALAATACLQSLGLAARH